MADKDKDKKEEPTKVEAADVVLYYDADANPNGLSYPGVPLTDLTKEQYEAMPKWIQKSVDASDFYRKTRPRKAAASDNEAPAEETNN